MNTRGDIILATFSLVLLVLFGNCFVSYEKDVYKNTKADRYAVGYPADENYVQVVSTMEELEKAYDEDRRFAIKVDTDKIQKTSHYSSLQKEGDGFIKAPVFFIHMFSVLDKYPYDRVYVIELEDGNRIPVQMYGDALDFSQDSITLPVAEKKFYANPTKTLTAIDKKFDLTTEDATTWMVNASGYSLTLQDEFRDKRDLVFVINWGIIVGGMIIYTIVSTILIVKKRKRNA